MRTKELLIGGGILLGAGILLATRARRTIPKKASAVKPFDVQKYLGKWNEIARMEYRFEKNIIYATAEYSLEEDGSIQVVNSGFNYKKQKIDTAIGKARFVGSQDEAKLEVSFWGPFYSGYNVVAIDPKYKYALIVGRNLNYMWILSRDKKIPDKIKEEYLNMAEGIGYDTSKLVWTKYD